MNLLLRIMFLDWRQAGVPNNCTQYALLMVGGRRTRHQGMLSAIMLLKYLLLRAVRCWRLAPRRACCAAGRSQDPCIGCGGAPRTVTAAIPRTVPTATMPQMCSMDVPAGLQLLS